MRRAKFNKHHVPESCSLEPRVEVASAVAASPEVVPEVAASPEVVPEVMEVPLQAKKQAAATNALREQKQFSRGQQMVLLSHSKPLHFKISRPELRRPTTSKYQEHEPLNVREINPELLSKCSDVPIGSGTFGKCFLSSYRNIKVVAKEMKFLNDTAKEKERARSNMFHEASVLIDLADHPGIPLLFGVCSLSPPYQLVIQFYGAGHKARSLTLYKAAKAKMFDKTQTLVILQEIANILQYIHGKGYLHNELKADNILINSKESDEYKPIIIDFGKSCRITEGEAPRKRNGGDYLAPEVREGKSKENIASDLHSFGKLIQSIVYKRSFAHLFKDIIDKATTHRPNERPGICFMISMLKNINVFYTNH